MLITEKCLKICQQFAATFMIVFIQHTISSVIIDTVFEVLCFSHVSKCTEIFVLDEDHYVLLLWLILCC